MLCKFAHYLVNLVVADIPVALAREEQQLVGIIVERHNHPRRFVQALAVTVISTRNIDVLKKFWAAVLRENN